MNLISALNIFTNLYDVVIKGNRWQLYLKGILNSLTMSLIACILGIIIAVCIALVKVFHTKSGKFKALNVIANIYTTVIRGTPVLVQLLIIWFVIFKFVPNDYGVLVASLAFGLNSGAYVSEIIRAGIQSIDLGQTEAGLSLGLNEKQTMWLIVMPQALKNILPALFNEL